MDALSRVGHLYLPFSNLLYQIASPLRSQMIALIRSARLPRNKYKSPDNGLLPSASAIVAHRPSNDRRISTGFTAMKMRAPLGSLSIGPMPARARGREAHRPIVSGGQNARHSGDDFDSYRNRCILQADRRSKLDL